MTAFLVPVESGTPVQVCDIDGPGGEWCGDRAREVLYLRLPGEDVETQSPRCRRHPAGRTADAIRDSHPQAWIRIGPAAEVPGA